MKRVIVRFYLYIIAIYSNTKYRFLTSIHDFPKIESDVETLEMLSKGKSLCRFGDGEFKIINEEKIGFQEYNKNLECRLKEILYSKSKNIMIGIPRISESEYLELLTKESRNFWKRDFVVNKKIWYSFENSYVFYDASVTRPYIRFADKNHSQVLFDLWKKVWYKKNILIVEGCDTKLGVNNDLFLNAKDIKRILCPSENAFLVYDKILTEVLKYSTDCIILIALGPTATVLAYDLSQYNVQAIDIGHIDIEYEWWKANAKSRARVKGKYVNEISGGNEVVDIENQNYLDQIVIKIF